MTETQTLSFPDDSSLDLLIPDASDLDIETHVTTSSPIESRNVLLFEELLPVYIVLRSSLASFRHILQHVEINVTAHATSAAPPPRSQHPGAAPAPAPAPPEKPIKLSLDSVNLTSQDNPTLIDLSTDTKTTCAIWKTNVLLRYPSQKLHRPSIHFTASAVSKATEAPLAPIETTQHDYMTSALPASENLLQALRPGVQGTNLPYLPLSRIQKVASRASPTTHDARPLRTSSRLFPVYTAVLVKVHITPEHMSDILLSLDLESTKFADYGGVNVENIKASGSNMLIEPFPREQIASYLPTTLQVGDRSTFVYRLAQEKDSTGHSSTRPSNVTFKIHATAQISETCRVRLTARWHGNVNFPQAQSVMRMPPRPQSMQSHSDFTTPRPMSKRISSTTNRPTSSTTQIETGGVLFAFTGPESVIEGETFHLDVFVVNRSQRRKRLAIIAIPKSARASAHHALRFPNISRQDSHSTAEAILDDRTIFHMQDKRETDIAEVVCLNADVRVGPLPSGACHNVQLEFLTLSTGLVGLAAVHVVDLESRETTQITELPDIMVTKASLS